MEQVSRIAGRRNRCRWMNLGMLVGACMIVVPAWVQAESGTVTAPATPQAQEMTPVQIQQQQDQQQQEKLRTELKRAEQRIASLEKQVKQQQGGDPSLSWGVSLAGF